MQAIMQHETPPRACLKCGNHINPVSRFCATCGTENKTASETQIEPAVLPATVSGFETHVSFQSNGGVLNNGTDERTGRVIEGKYRLEARIAAGGMGTVYRATRLLIGDTVAIKILHPEHVTDEAAAERFRREAQAAARLKHPNAVSIYDFGVADDGLVYLVMELVEGESLREIIKKQGPLTPSAAAEITRQACAALDEAHRQQIIHRDVKPDNIVVHTVGNNLRVKVLDFGIAKLRDMAATNMTQTGSVMGTPHYMSPEQCVGEELDGRSDVYSVGIVLYEMLAGVVPFNSPTSTAVVVQHVTQIPPSLRAINMSISEPVERVVQHALEKRRENRPATAGALGDELTVALNSPQTSQFPVSMPTAATPALPLPTPATDSGMMPTMVLKNASAWTSGAVTPSNGLPLNAPGVSASSPFAAHGGQNLTTTARRNVPLIVIGAAVLIAGLATAGYFLFTGTSARQLVLDEIKKNQLTKPEGSSAYDLYLKHRATLNAEDKQEINKKALPELEKRGNEILSHLKQDQIEAETDWNEAGRIYDWLNELEPRAAYDSRKHFAQARLAFLQKDYSKAQAEFQRSIQLDSSWALPYNSLGRVFVNNNDKIRAKEQYRRATEVEPNWIYPWINLGALYFGMNDLMSAEAALRRAVAIDGQKVSAHKLLADVLDKQGRSCEALVQYKAVIEASSNNATAPGFDLDAVNRKIQILSSTTMCQ